MTTLQKKLPTKIPEIKPVVRKNSEEDSSFTARNATGSVKDKESQFFSVSASIPPLQKTICLRKKQKRERDTVWENKKETEREKEGKGVSKLLLVNKILY